MHPVLGALVPDALGVVVVGVGEGDVVVVGDGDVGVGVVGLEVGVGEVVLGAVVLGEVGVVVPARCSLALSSSCHHCCTGTPCNCMRSNQAVHASGMPQLSSEGGTVAAH